MQRKKADNTTAATKHTHIAYAPSSTAPPSSSSRVEEADVSRSVSSRISLWHCALVFSVAAVVYSNVLQNGFAFDDMSTIERNPLVVQGGSLSEYFTNDFWATPMISDDSHKSYRPVTTFSYRLTYMLVGANPFYFHLTDIILHAITSVVVMYACEILLLSADLSVLASVSAAVLFASHPIHTEAVANATGRADVLASLFFLLGFIYYHKSAVNNTPLWVCRHIYT
jgi:protein O-mannosyl-transferase